MDCTSQAPPPDVPPIRVTAWPAMYTADGRFGAEVDYIIQKRDCLRQSPFFPEADYSARKAANSPRVIVASGVSVASSDPSALKRSAMNPSVNGASRSRSAGTTP